MKIIHNIEKLELTAICEYMYIYMKVRSIHKNSKARYFALGGYLCLEEYRTKIIQQKNIYVEVPKKFKLLW